MAIVKITRISSPKTITQVSTQKTIALIGRGIQGPPGSGALILNAITGLDGTATGATNLWLATADAIVIGFVARLTAVVGFTSVPNISVIISGGGGTIVPQTQLFGADTANDNYHAPVSGIVPLVLGSTQVQVNVDAAAVATTYTLSIDLLGYIV